MQVRLRWRIASLFVAVVWPQLAWSDPIVVFSTFGPGFTYDAQHGWSIAGGASFHAFQFAPTQSGSLNDITVATFGVSNTPQRVQFDLYRGPVTEPETLLESRVVPNTPGTKVVTFSSLSRPSLAAGESYWLLFRKPTGADEFSATWQMNNQGILGPHVSSFMPFVANDFLPAFSVSVLPDPAPVPEPASIALLGIGLAAALTRLRCKTPR